jgi:adenylate cyclase
MPDGIEVDRWRPHGVFALLLTGAAPLLPMLAGSAINIWYNIDPLLTSAQDVIFTAIGDTVNVASRVESLTKVVKQPLLITKATYQALRDAPPLEPLPPQHVKGLHAPVEVLRLAAN